MSNETKQTIVEQFAIALYEGGYLRGNGDEIEKLLNTFQEMEKQEMKHWFRGGMHLVEESLWKPSDKFEEIYNEIYGGNK